MGMVVPIAAMRVHYHMRPLRGPCPGLRYMKSSRHWAPHRINALNRAPCVVEGCAEHDRNRQDDVTIDHPLVDGLADLTDPVVHVDFGAP